MRRFLRALAVLAKLVRAGAALRRGWRRWKVGAVLALLAGTAAARIPPGQLDPCKDHAPSSPNLIKHGAYRPSVGTVPVSTPRPTGSGLRRR
jgi:hypothetical protein